MIAEEHIQTATDFLAASDREFDAGDVLQGSEKLWGAFSHAVTAISMTRGWDYGTHRKTINAALALADQLNDGWLTGGNLRGPGFPLENFYHGSMEDYEMDAGRPVVRNFVERVAGLLNQP